MIHLADLAKASSRPARSRPYARHGIDRRCGANMDTEVNIFQADGEWVVVVADSTYRFGDRQEAFRKARELARLHAPSVILSAPVEVAEEPSRPQRAVVSPAIFSSTDAVQMLDSFAGPPALGRSVLLSPGDTVPTAWRWKPVQLLICHITELGVPN